MGSYNAFKASPMSLVVHWYIIDKIFIENGVKSYYDINKMRHIHIPILNKFTILENLRSTSIVWKNEGVSLIDIGNEILNIEFFGKKF